MEITKILESIEEEEAVELTKDLIRYPSPPGKEKDVGQFILEWYRQNGIETIKQDLGGERLNAIGIIRGTERGLSLSLNGHMDTSYGNKEEDTYFMGTELLERPAHQPQAYVEGRTIYGLGVGNMKAGLAAMMLAVKAVKGSGVNLKGNLIAAAVVGETGRAPIGSYQGIEFESVGYGTRYLLTHGIHSDYAICVDGSNLKITWAQPGWVFLRITVYGLPGLPWASTTSDDKRSSQNAILKMIPVIEAIDRWSADYTLRKTYKCPGGTIVPKANITSIEAGRPYRPSQRPGICYMTMAVDIPPGTRPVDITREVDDTIKKEGVDAKVDMYWSTLGYEAEGVSGLVKVIGENYENLFGSALEIADPLYCSVWTDTNIYNEVGIPCVKIGLGLPEKDFPKFGIDAYDSHPIDDIVKGARLYTMVALDVCTRTSLES